MSSVANDERLLAPHQAAGNEDLANGKSNLSSTHQQNQECECVRTTLKRNILSSQVGPNANVLLFVDLGGIIEEAILRHILERNPAANAK